MNLELALVIATMFTGLICLAARYIARGRVNGAEATPAQGGKAWRALVEMSQSFFPVLLIVLIIRSFLFEPYKIPSSSMVPTLLIGDFIFVSKFSYGVRLPVIHNKVLSNGEPQRGDVAVFRLPRDPSVNYIKRIIGRPGDKLEYRDRRLRINGELVPLSPDGLVTVGEDTGLLFNETLGDTHTIMHNPHARSFPASITVPDDCYFVMGDNRDNSQDSRFPQVGCIPETNLVGRASRIWFNWQWGNAPRWSRIGDKIE